MAIINGTALDDVLATSLALDTINGLAGNDVFLVAAPAELVVGDKLDGGAGYDRLWFTSTNGGDTLALAALAPVKLFVAGIESVEIADDAGNTSGTTLLDLSAAGLTTGLILAGNDGVNSITGSAGADTIVGNGGVDTIFGGLGKDRIVSTAAQSGASDDMDQINAGALTEGNTLVLVGPVSANALVLDDLVEVDLTAVGDQVVVFSSTLPATPSAALGGLVQTGFANVDATGLVAAGLRVTASAPVNVLLGGDGNDLFIYTSSTHLTTDMVNGGSGIDTLRFASLVAAGQTLLLSATVFVEAVEIATTGALGVAVASGVQAHNVNAFAVKNAVLLTGNDGKNTLTGTKFADTINGNAGVDSMVGGDGNDLYVADSGTDWTTLGVQDKILDSKGTDDRIAFVAVGADTLVLGPNVKGVEAVWTTGTDFVITGTPNLNVDGSALGAGMSFVGNAGNNLLTGGKFNDKFNGNAGADTILGGLGNDTISWDVGATPDRIDAGLVAEGNTLALTGSTAVAVLVDLSLGADQMLGFADTQTGFSHVDASGLTGLGHVEVRGSLQKNLLTGSGQDDIFDFFLPGHFNATDRIDGGGGGNDTLRFSSIIAGQALLLNDLQLKNMEIVDLFDTNGAVIGTTALNITATAVATTKLKYLGNDGNNKISTGLANDTLKGNGGVDILNAGGGDDVIQVDSAADHVTGLTAATSDSIDGGLGTDELWFVSTVNTEVLVLNAGIKGIEKIRLTNDKGDAETFTDIGVNAALAPAGVNILGNDGANDITGSKFGDSIVGGKGTDNIVGGLGNDTIAMLLDAGESDNINAGTTFNAGNDKNLLMPVGDWNGAIYVAIDLSSTIDQMAAPGIQVGFWNVNGSQLIVPQYGAGLDITGTTRPELLIGTSRNDEFDGRGGADTLDGGGESDLYHIHALGELTTATINDTGGTAGDRIVFDYAGGTISLTEAMKINGIDVAVAGAAAGNLNINASALDRPMGLEGNAGNNILTGTRHGETLFDSGGGIDLLQGGEGSDEYVIDSQWMVGDKYYDLGTFGFDQLYYANPTFNSNDVLIVTSASVKGIERFVVSSSGLNLDGPNAPPPEPGYIRDVRSLTNAGIDISGYGISGQTFHLAGSYGDNRLTGSNFNDTIIGWQGTDTIVGGLGTDWIYVGASATDNDPIFVDPVVGNVDAVNAGLRSQGNHLLLHDTMPGIMVVDLSSDTDQITLLNRVVIDGLVMYAGMADPLVQTGFMHLDASRVTKPEGFNEDWALGVIVIGSAGANTMTGSNFDDAFVELSAADFAVGESITGGAGNDVIRFNPSTLLLPAGLLPQTLILTPGRMAGVEGAEISDEYGGDTTVAGIAANLNAAAMPFGMRLGGNSGANVITGTAFNDTIAGNGGVDSLVGGNGDDLYVVTDGLHVVAGDAINDTGGFNTLRFASSIVPAGSATAVLTAQMVGLDAVEITDAEGRPEGDPGATIPVLPVDLNLDASAVLNGLVMRGNDAINIITGTGFNDTIDGLRGVDTIMAGGGADRITIVLETDPLLVPMDSFDDIDGGAIAEGNTLVLQGKLVADTAPGGTMVWDLTAGDQLTSVNGGPDLRAVGNITHFDFSGLLNASVTVTGSSDGNDLVGTALDDTFITATEFVAGDKIAGGAGNDTLSFTSAANGDTLLVNGDITDIEFVELTGTADLAVNATGQLSGLKITGNAGANTITGGTGADTISVDVAMDDRVIGGAGGNMLVLTGAAAGAITVNLAILAGDQVTGIADTQSGFTSLDASLVTGFNVNVTGTAADNIIGIDAAQTSLVDALGGNDTLILGGAATALVSVDLSAVLDQVSPMAGNQAGFENVDASTMTAFGVNVIGSAAANRITGTALADTIQGGGGADVITVKVTGGVNDQVDAGGFGEGNKLVLTGDASAVFNVDLSATADQLTDEAVVQTGFQHVDASALGAFGMNARGNGLNNQLTGSLFGDTLFGGAGADTFVLGGGEDGDGAADRVTYERPGDGANSLAAPAGYDRVFDFEAGIDKIVFGGQFNSGSSNLDDIADNNSFVFALDEKADFSGMHEAMLITAEKSLLKTELQLATLATVASNINNAKRGVIAATGDDGLILVQASSGIGDAAIFRTGIYYYQEMDGILNKVSAGELILLGVVEGKLTNSDVLLA